jgi:hypothetical protein
MAKPMLSVIAFFLLLSSCLYAAPAADVILETAGFRYIVTPDGKNSAFFDKASGTDYLDHRSASACAHIRIGKTDHAVTFASYANDLLILKFAPSPIVAKLKTNRHAQYIEMEVAAIEGGPIDAFEFISVPLTLQARPEEPFAACAFSLNTFTEVRQLPALQSELSAFCYKRFGLVGAKAALVAVPMPEILATLRTIVSAARDLPSIRTAGAWANETEFNHGSYLFNFGTLTEANADEWIEMTRSLGFNQIDNHGGSKFFRFGDLELNREKWPQGWQTYKRILDRLHQAGIGSILHTYAFFIDKGARYVTPVPHPQLDAFRSFTLAEPITADAKEIRVKESTADMSTVTGFFVHNSITLHVGDELITFSGVNKTPPYGFSGCQRGAYGTKAAPHSLNSRLRHLKECFGLFVPDCESPLFEEIAKRHAEIVDSCGFDGFYLDAIDGSGLLRGNDEAWYWGQHFVFLIYRHLRKPVSLELSSMWHQMWNFRSRWQAWDHPSRGHKRFVDIHADAVHSGLLLPMHLGWWNFQHFAPPQEEPCFPDVIDYLGCRLIGYDAGLSLTGAVNQDNLKKIPLYRRLVDRLKIYEDLRHHAGLDESIKKRLREPGKEFTLSLDSHGAYGFKPVHYEKHKVVDSLYSNSWQVHNPFGEQPIRLRIEALMSTGSFDDAGNIVLADMAGTPAAAQSAKGVTQAIAAANDPAPFAGTATSWTAAHSSQVEQRGAWANRQWTFSPMLDVKERKAIGVWIEGDGHGEILNFRLESPEHLAYGAIADHYVTIDFSGWRYFALVETESERWSDYIWNDGKSLYNVYRENIHFDAIERFSVWYNNLPAGQSVKCRLSPIKAVPMEAGTYSNIELQVNAGKIIFPVTMVSGDVLEFDSERGWIHYGAKGEEKGIVRPVGVVPILRNGINEISCKWVTSGNRNARMQVTTISYGQVL